MRVGAVFAAPREQAASLTRVSRPTLDADVLAAALATHDLGAFVIDCDDLTLQLDACCVRLLELETPTLTLDALLAHAPADQRAHATELFTNVSSADVHVVLDWTPPAAHTSRRIEVRGRFLRLDGAHSYCLAGTLRLLTTAPSLSVDPRDTPVDDSERAVVVDSEAFVGILAHDLRSPLAGIMTAAQAAARPLDEARRESLLASVVVGGARMARMIDQLLDFTCARVGSGIPLHCEPADLVPIAKAVVAELADLRSDGIVSLRSEGVTTGQWDADRLSQVLANLVGNAIEHGAATGSVRVDVDGTLADSVIVTIRNDGMVPAELVPALFHPFRAMHQRRKGSRALGLGLYVSRQIVLAHGGEIKITSSEAEGTTVRVTLPRTTPVPTVGAKTAIEEAIALERMAHPTPSTTVTAQLFGAASLPDRAPRAYAQVFERYCVLLDELVRRRAFKETAEEAADLSRDLRAIADRLGALNAGAREVAELHARAIRLRTRGVAILKSQALITEGRLVSFELMGHLLSYYRRRAGFSGSGVIDE